MATITGHPSRANRVFPGLALGWRDPVHNSDHLNIQAQKRKQVIKTIDGGGFKWSVWAVAATGFFTDSYNLFATNVILPILLYVYWPYTTLVSYTGVINLLTLAGSMVGQLLFGLLADNYGRQKLYGVELIVVIFTTIGVTQSSSGVHNSMSMLGWLSAWRFLMGVGIGAEYPLSSVITAEWAPTRSRARMMAAVFIMQPLGQLAAALVGLWVALGLQAADQDLNEDRTEAARRSADVLWRYVTGVGTIPTLIALIFRLTIPETPRYTLDMQKDFDEARRNAELQYPALDPDLQRELESDFEDNISTAEVPEDPVPFSKKDLKQYFITEGNWLYLAGTSLCWFLFDIAFYGLGIDNPRTLAKLWTSDKDSTQYLPSDAHTSSLHPESLTAHQFPNWAADYTQARNGLYQSLIDNGVHSIVLVSVGSIAGSALMIWLIEYIPRRKVLIGSCVWLAILLTATGICFHWTFTEASSGVTMALFVLCQASFNFGPNTLTFILPAELFPTRYRCTCHGISAAAGKFGSILIQLIFTTTTYNGRRMSHPASDVIGWYMVGFGGVMALAGLVAKVCIPNVQEYHSGKSYRLPSKGLEELAEGRKRAESDGQAFGLRRRKPIEA